MRNAPSIRSKRDFRTVFATGRRGRRGAVTVHVLGRGDPTQPARLGLAVRTERGRAVTRNRARRRLREAFARCGERGADVVVSGDERAATLPFQQLVDDVRAALREARR